eukprot:TRINITY_DN68199_c0_g1_i1.p1 TRINITY_DN68199_c0_g1~~TRINITY_DN68199_c0_g1_i1.p1  ORF type:complete len:402 (+),score=35.81 TRINITY_DN68199_c0_g1_i1:97-1206(+)
MATGTASPVGHASGDEFSLEIAASLKEMHDDQNDDEEALVTGAYATLHADGPMHTPGSAGHPNSCEPCTFYCFTHRGCNRGVECRFCHLVHKSKLQQRRDSWKRQQRERRKMFRENAASNAQSTRRRSETNSGLMAPGDTNLVAAARRPSSLDGNQARCRGRSKGNVTPQHSAATDIVADVIPNRPPTAKLESPRRSLSPWGQNGGNCATPVSIQNISPTGSLRNHVGPSFSYSEKALILAIGQEVNIQPNTSAAPLNFKLESRLPEGLHFSSSAGSISGAPTLAFSRSMICVAAEFADFGVFRAAFQLEVIDFTSRNFVVDHLCEFEPGKYMMLVYTPEDGSEAQGGDVTSFATQPRGSQVNWNANPL